MSSLANCRRRPAVSLVVSVFGRIGRSYIWWQCPYMWWHYYGAYFEILSPPEAVPGAFI